MKFKEIVNKVDWYDVRDALVLSYEDSSGYLEEYLKVFKKFKTLEPIDCKGMKLYVEYNTIIENEEFVEVVGRDGKLQRESEDFEFIKKHIDEKFANSEIIYALEMVEWAEWLDMEVPMSVIKVFSFPSIVAHCLYEMTFMGFDQEEVREKKELLEDSISKAKEYMKDPEKYKDMFVDSNKFTKNEDGSLNLDEINKIIDKLNKEVEEDDSTEELL
jgi:hypothetical protein